MIPQQPSNSMKINNANLNERQKLDNPRGSNYELDTRK